MEKNNNMIVLKFGGTSVGTADRIKALPELIDRKVPVLVVLSAMAGTTNTLVEIAQCLYQSNKEAALSNIKTLELRYEKTIRELFTDPIILDKATEMLRVHCDFIRSFTRKMFTQFEEKAILAQGELISTALFHFYLNEIQIKSCLIPALNFMRMDDQGEPDQEFIRKNLKAALSQHPDDVLFITQGYICRNAFGEVDNLQRGGSDYTASLIGAALQVKEIQIWTDIDGMHNNDPRIVRNTKPIARLSFDEAAELAYFGAKILHPSSVLPAKRASIPVRLKNTMKPDASGTLISNETGSEQIKAVAAKDGIVAIKIKSGRMLLAYGFMRKVFEIFESYKTPIDMITTSEVAVSLTIDQVTHLEKIQEELNRFGTVEVDHALSIICIVGDFIAESKGQAFRIFSALQEIPVRMISYGGSRHNVSVLVQTSDKESALQALHHNLFEVK